MREDESVVPPRWQALPPWQHAVAAAVLADRGRWPHAVLLAGRRGIGKRILALHLAQAMLCEKPLPNGSACGSCLGCGYVAGGQHPDLRLIEPIKYDEEGNPVPVDEIIVDRIRELIDFAQLTTHRQGPKVALICPAETMNAQAANALLKTLEEPPGTMYFILVSHQPGRLPATIVSRCRRLPAPEPEPAAGSAWLSEQGVERPELVLAQSGGAPLLALTLADPTVQYERDALLAELARPERLSPVEFGARLDLNSKEERKARLAETVYWLLTWTADLASVASGGAPRFNPDQRDALARLAGRVARLPLFRYYRALLRQRALLGHPLQPRLVAEALLFEYRTLFARGTAD